VERDASTHFSIKTQGEAIVLQMLRPVESGVKVYKVDSTITFGGEISSGN
jgi:septum formation inhibitor MinC